MRCSTALPEGHRGATAALASYGRVRAECHTRTRTSTVLSRVRVPYGQRGVNTPLIYESIFTVQYQPCKGMDVLSITAFYNKMVRVMCV